ncbi:MAG: NfeD family protein [Chitinispirillaceae bacterium]
MLRISTFILLITFLLSSLSAQTDVDDSAADTASVENRAVVVIPVSGTVDPGMAAFIGRTLREAAEQYDSPLIVLEMNTFGGRVDAAYSIVDSVVAVKNASTVAYVQSKAISAGALIALSADQLVMRSNTTIGDVAPLIMSDDGPQMLGEKYQSPLRAKFRTLARKNGYSEALTESMVTAQMEVFEVKLPDTVLYLDSTRLAELDPSLKEQIVSTRTVVREGELLTMTDSEAAEYGFSKMTVSNFDEMLGKMGYGDSEVVRMEESWSEALVRLIGSLSSVLMMIGFAALYIELRSPGFGVPGIVGIVCLGLVFFGQYMVGLADYTELLFLVAGIIFLAIEFFVIPGFGVAGFVGIALMVVGMVLSFQNFVIPQPEFPWQMEILTNNLMRVLISILGAIILIFIFFRYFFERLGRVVSGPYLATSLEGIRADSETLNMPHVGDKGVTITSLRPSGKVSVDGEIYDVVAEGEFLDKDAPVVVSQIQGNRIVVNREVAS